MMSAADSARWFAVREAVIKGRHVSSIIDLEDKLFEADAEKRRLEEERDTTHTEVAALRRRCVTSNETSACWWCRRGKLSTFTADG